MSAPAPNKDDAAEIASTSSSEYLSPTVPGTSELLRALCVEVVENQRWFPIYGWATSRLSEDPPNFTLPLRVFSAHHSPNQQAFARAMVESNPDFFRVLKNASPSIIDYNIVPQEPLSYAVPSGYEWEDEWYVPTDNPRGCDPAGWRYGTGFDTPGSEHRVHFKKTWSQDCVVRRRIWRRYVHLAGPISSHNPSPPAHDDDSRVYIEEKQDEMKLAESLKKRRTDALANGGTWTTEDDLAAEEEIRTFVRARRGQYSTTNRLSHNPSFANPFEQAPSSHSADASPTSARSTEPRIPSRHPPDAAASTAVTDFRQYEPSDTASPQVDEPMVPQPSISAFLPSTSPVASHDQQPTYPINVEAQGTDFDAIFSKFVNNPEINK